MSAQHRLGWCVVIWPAAAAAAAASSASAMLLFQCPFSDCTAGECGQCHAVSVRAKLNVDLFDVLWFDEQRRRRLWRWTWCSSARSVTAARCTARVHTSRLMSARTPAKNPTGRLGRHPVCESAPSPDVSWQYFPNDRKILNKILHACREFISTQYQRGIDPGAETICLRRWQFDGGKKRGGCTPVCGRQTARL